MPTPTLRSTNRHTASKLRNWTRRRGEEGTQSVRQNLGERVGIREHAHLAGLSARISAELFTQALGLRQDRARVLQQRAAGLRRRDAAASAHQKRRAERLLHLAN